jgi:hypothetical protein
MKITHRKFELQRLSEPEFKCLVVGYNVADDGGSEFYCLISERSLDPTGSYAIADGSAMEALFDAKKTEVLEATKPVVDLAKAHGIRHTPGQPNEPLRVSLRR